MSNQNVSIYDSICSCLELCYCVCSVFIDTSPIMIMEYDEEVYTFGFLRGLDNIKCPLHERDEDNYCLKCGKPMDY